MEIFGNPWMIVAVVAIPAAIHVVIGSFVAPRLMAHGLELHPVTILLSLAFWGLLWGIVGRSWRCSASCSRSLKRRGRWRNCSAGDCRGAGEAMR